MNVSANRFYAHNERQRGGAMCFRMVPATRWDALKLSIKKLVGSWNVRYVADSR